jgi:hypothetical protein
LALLVLLALALSACTESIGGITQVPGSRGLLATLEQYETGVKWKNWSILLENYYLSDHVEEARKKFGNDLQKWFLADKFTASIFVRNAPKLRYTCILALREKHFSSKFEPHFVVYYRIQKIPCQEDVAFSDNILAEGQMEWGFETKEKRWVHLRKLG